MFEGRGRIMKYDLIIKNGHVFAPEDLGVIDIGIKNKKIIALSSDLGKEAHEVIMADGKLVLPGLIESHGHMLLPFGGTITKNDFYEGTKAGAFGGVTTLIDFADQKKGELPLTAIEKRMKQAEGKATVDYSFHCTLTDINQETLRQIELIMNMGITSVKIYTTYKNEGLCVDDGEILAAFQKIAELGGIVTVHAENETIINRATSELKSKGQISPMYFPLSKPRVSEEEAIYRVLLLAKKAEVPVLIRHVSSAEGVRAIEEAKKSGQKVYGETCPHYLTFTSQVYQRDDGRNYIVHPPIREDKDLKELWQGIRKGVISVIGTDDCAFTTEQKRLSDAFYGIPGGMPGIETRLSIMYTEGVYKGQISMEQLVKVTSTNVAKLYGVYPQKGTIKVGSDADLIVYDPLPENVIKAGNLHGKSDWTPFEGWKVRGKLDLTLAKGKVIVRGDEFLASAGEGCFLKRSKGLYI
jgi:dihydropyrimidinase